MTWDSPLPSFGVFVFVARYSALDASHQIRQASRSVEVQQDLLQKRDPRLFANANIYFVRCMGSRDGIENRIRETVALELDSSPCVPTTAISDSTVTETSNRIV